MFVTFCVYALFILGLWFALVLVADIRRAARLDGEQCASMALIPVLLFMASIVLHVISR